MKFPWVTRKKYEEDMLNLEIDLFIKSGELFEQIMENEELSEKNAELAKELDACWKCINARNNRPQKCAKDGKWCK